MKSTILYIEDEEDYQILVSRILGRAGWTVRTASTGEEGLAALRQERPTLLLLDINLPDTDGYRICEQLRADPAFADLPVLMLTVRRRPEEWLKGFSCGANDYLAKPFDPKGLIERVENGLSGQSLRLSDKTTPEYQLIQAAVAGNRAAFEVLIHKYRERLISALQVALRASPELAEDLAGFAFVRAYESLAEFRGEASFYTWLYRIGLNEFYNSHRRQEGVSFEPLPRFEDAPLQSALAASDGTDQTLASTQESDELRRVISTIPEIYREVLELFFLKDMTYGAIAKQLDVPIGTVMSRLFKARALLKKRWAREQLTVPGKRAAAGRR
jgi:RNA polymerase sigma factor (sigma-70 family)